ncbi:MAG: YacL family protein [Colwellia sp.]|nr:YacL family protein [Colwellia sp.]
MEYEFVHDAITGEARALFSLEHEVIGPWMEVEVGHNVNKLTDLLTAIDNIETGQSQEILITGSEYSITLNNEDVSIQTNVSMNGSLNGSGEGLPEMLTDEHIHLDQNEIAACGLDDFRALLLSWGQFTNSLS